MEIKNSYYSKNKPSVVGDIIKLKVEQPPRGSSWTQERAYKYTGKAVGVYFHTVDVHASFGESVLSPCIKEIVGGKEFDELYVCEAHNPIEGETEAQFRNRLLEKAKEEGYDGD